VNDLLDLSRASPPHRESVVVASFVRSTLHKCASSGAAVETIFPPTYLPWKSIPYMPLK
jgi:hypothetical protein